MQSIVLSESSDKSFVHAAHLAAERAQLRRRLCRLIEETCQLLDDDNLLRVSNYVLLINE